MKTAYELFGKLCRMNARMKLLIIFNIHVVIIPTWKKFLGEFSRFGGRPPKKVSR